MYIFVYCNIRNAYMRVFDTYEVTWSVRDRPFNLQGGGYGFLFRSEFFFRTTRELEYFFNFFPPEFSIRLYDKNSESDYFFPPPKSEYFFSNIGNQNIFFRKKNHTPPLPPPEVKWSVPNPRLITLRHSIHHDERI